MGSAEIAFIAAIATQIRQDPGSEKNKGVVDPLLTTFLVSNFTLAKLQFYYGGVEICLDQALL